MQNQLTKSFSAWGRKAITASLLVATALFTVACSSDSTSSTSPTTTPAAPKVTVLYPAQLATGKKIPIAASDVTAKSITVDLNVNSFSTTAAAGKIRVFLSSNRDYVLTNNAKVLNEVSVTAANAKNGLHTVSGVAFRGLGGNSVQSDAITPAEGTKYYLKAVTVQGSGASEVKNESALVEFSIKVASKPTLANPSAGAKVTPILLTEADGATEAASAAKLKSKQSFKLNWTPASGTGITAEPSAYAIGLGWLATKPTKDAVYEVAFNDASLAEIQKYVLAPVKQADLDATYDVKKKIAMSAQVAFVVTTQHADFDLTDPGTFKKLSVVEEYLTGAFVPAGAYGLNLTAPTLAAVTAKKDEQVDATVAFTSPAPALKFKDSMSNVILYKKDATATAATAFLAEAGKVTANVGAAKTYAFSNPKLVAGGKYTFHVQTFGRNPFTGVWGTDFIPQFTAANNPTPAITTVTIPYTVGLALATGATVTKTTTSVTYILAEAIDTALFDVAVKFTVADAAGAAVPNASSTAVTAANISVTGAGAEANRKLTISGLTANKYYRFYITATPKTTGSPAPSTYIKAPATPITTTEIQTSAS